VIFLAVWFGLFALWMSWGWMNNAPTTRPRRMKDPLAHYPPYIRKYLEKEEAKAASKYYSSKLPPV
jgi:hypothetical protein